VKAFRDTWRDGIHSYLSYLRDRLAVARDLLTESGSVFVQIGDENVHLIKSLLGEVFGEENYVNTIAIKKKGSTLVTETVLDFVVWFAKRRVGLKVHKLYLPRALPEDDDKYNTLVSQEFDLKRVRELAPYEIEGLVQKGWRWVRVNYPLVSQHPHERR